MAIYILIFYNQNRYIEIISYSPVAQLVEPPAHNRNVTGSSPVRTTLWHCSKGWPNASDCRSDDFGLQRFESFRCHHFYFGGYMKIYQQELTYVDKVKDIICDICLQSCIPQELKNENIIERYGVQITYRANYFSKCFDDNTLIKIDLCEQCLKNLYDKRPCNSMVE